LEDKSKKSVAFIFQIFLSKVKIGKLPINQEQSFSRAADCPSPIECIHRFRQYTARLNRRPKNPAFPFAEANRFARHIQ